MLLRIAPLTLAGLTLAAAVDAQLLIDLADLATKEPPAPEHAEWTPRLPAASEQAAPAQPIAEYRQTLARPLFVKTRAPFVPPPPPPPPVQAQRPAPPAPVFVDPGFAVGGVMISGMIRQAYLMQKPEPHGTWVREGEDFMGWKVQSISAGAAKLQRDDRTIEVRLYPERQLNSQPSRSSSMNSCPPANWRTGAAAHASAGTSSIEPAPEPPARRVVTPDKAAAQSSAEQARSAHARPQAPFLAKRSQRE